MTNFSGVAMGLIKTRICLKNPRQPDLAGFEGDALVDTGTIDLCLPTQIVDMLRLETLEHRSVQLADGSTRQVPYVGPVQVQWDGRGCFVGALAFGNQVLLGALPMEDMNLIPCPRDQKIIVNPNPQIV